MDYEFILLADHSTRPSLGKEEAIEQWTRFHEAAQADGGKYRKGHPKVVDKTSLPGNIEVSTVFLIWNHAFLDEQPPILFETMIFGGNFDNWCQRYSTWEEAEKGHQEVVERIKSGNMDWFHNNESD